MSGLGAVLQVTILFNSKQIKPDSGYRFGKQYGYTIKLQALIILYVAELVDLC